jgi:proline dehydrogenase
MNINRFTCSYKQLNTILKKLNSQNMKPILDNINEIYNPNNFRNIKKSIIDYPNNYFAIKLSSLGIQKIPDNKLYQKLDILSNLAIKNNSKILIDAENHTIQDQIYDITNNLIAKYNKDEVNIYKTYQMYRWDTYDILKKDLEKYNNLGIKLVRGAYLNQDTKYGYIHDNKYYVDKDFNNAIRLYFDNYKYNNSNIILATHNLDSVNYSLKLYNKSNSNIINNLNNNYNLDNRLKYAQLMGMGDILSSKLVEKNMEVYKYLPYGNFHETIPYLIRRLYENYPMIPHLFK